MPACLALVTNLILSLLILESPTGYRHKPCNNTGVYLVRGRDRGLPGQGGGVGLPDLRMSSVRRGELYIFCKQKTC